MYSLSAALPSSRSPEIMDSVATSKRLILKSASVWSVLGSCRRSRWLKSSFEFLAFHSLVVLPS